MKKLIWRLKEQPTTESLRDLVSNGILTKEEAREILFNTETQEDRDKQSLQSEIKFLRDLVERLSNKNTTKIVEVIREVEKPYRVYPWYQPYIMWSDTTDNIALCGTATTGGGSGSGGLELNATNTASTNFSEIKTF